MLLAKALAEQGQCKLGPVTAVFAAKRKGPRGAVIEAWAPLPGEYALFLADNVEVSPLLLVAAEAFVNAYGEVQLTPETARLSWRSLASIHLSLHLTLPSGISSPPLVIRLPACHVRTSLDATQILAWPYLYSCLETISTP